MQTIKLHSSLPDFSRLVYGAWRLNDGADNSPAEALTKIQTVLDVGITSFDHADIYGDYACEALFGKAFQQLPSSVRANTQHVTKCDIALKSSQFPDRRVKHYDTTPAYIRQSVDNSLQRLGLDVLDVLLIHRPDPLMNAVETGACLDELIAIGKIRTAGVSNFMPHDFDLLQSAMQTPLITNQLEISVLCTHAFKDGTLAQAQRLKRSPMAWSPLAGGKLFGDEAAAKRVRPILQGFADSAGVGIDAVAVAWLLMHPANIIPVLGTNDVRRIKTIPDAFKVKLSRENWFEILQAANGQEVA